MSSRAICQCFSLILISAILSAPGLLADGNVTLVSVTIFRTHEWLGKPSVYFRCRGEKKVYLPDVVEKNHQYKFIGQESWQPLTSLEGSKCKRCGLYEEDQLKHDDTFDEWELCPTQFTLEPEGYYNHFKEKEFNITFLCANCHPAESKSADQPAGTTNDEERGSVKQSPLLVTSIIFSIVILIAIAYFGYKKWQKKKREEQQARFIKLFEDDEDLEAELGLRD